MVIMIVVVEVMAEMDLRDTQFLKNYLIMEISLKIEISKWNV